MNYGQLPKGLLLFHMYAEGPRTPMEEHLVEGALYAASNGEAHVHFTVSHEHMELFRQKVEQKVRMYTERYGIRYDITFSEQKPSTDTVAANPDGTPFRNGDGSLLFRPGGHGALIENLNEIDADVIFVKNIDNVVPDRLKDETVEWKQVIAGVLVTLQQQAFEYLRLLDAGATEAQLEEMAAFVEKCLCIAPNGAKVDAEYLRRKLNRPMRVCGVVKNVGEPGGGPFLTYNQDGTVSLQILESSQIDKSNKEYMEMFTKGTHFNPVDLVCAVRDYKGQPFDLPKYVDPSTGFISQKSKSGKELQALELIREEALRMKQSGMDTGELARVKEQIKAGMLMGMEDTGSRRSWITRNELIYGREITVDEVIRKVDAVTQADILKAAARIFDMSKVSISVVGTPQTEADYLKIFRK